MTRIQSSGGGSLVAIAATAAGALVLPSPAFGQAVADRTLSDLNVENVGSCTTLTVNFNIRVQMLSHFPTTAGRELHIRVRPLDEGSEMGRESLRTPASVKALRSVEFEGDNPSGPVLSLFFTRDMRFEVEAGKQPQSLVIRIAEPGTGPICAGGTPGMPAPPVSGASTAAPLPAMEIPAGLYAINVLSTPKLSELTSAQKSAITGKVAYETQFERDSQQWHRIRVGFFESREAAEAARQKLLTQYPEAWVVKVTADERAQGVASRMDTGAPAATAAPPASAASDADIAETARLVSDAEQAIRDDQFDRAIQLLTNALGKPENANTPRAQELLGLTRERKGQNAQAQAEYEEYLRRYPAAEAADRVQQRLAAIRTPTSATTPALRAASGNIGGATTWTWGARGSFSQFYFRDQSKTKFIDSQRVDRNDREIDNSVNLNQLLTTADLTISGGNDRRQIQMRAAGSYTRDFRPPSRQVIDPLTGQALLDPATGNPILQRRHVKTLTALYLDYSDADANMSARVGRQTRNSSGVLGRFDGMLVGWQARPKLRFNVVGGFPVLTSRQTHVLKERYFYGASVDIGAKRSPLQTSIYWFDQRAKGGFIDRQSVGIESRVLLSRFNAFTIVDYDVKHSKLNLGLVTLSYSFPDNSNLSVTADYRQSPLLTTYNALTGLSFASTNLPVDDLRQLRPFFTDAQIYRAARDNTLVAKSATVSYSRPLTKKLQANLDFTLSDTGGTRGILATTGTNAVAAQPATGTEYYYGAQLVGSGMLWENDIYILSGRYADTQNARTYTADFNARVPINSKFRLSPRLRYGYRKDKPTAAAPVAGDFRQLQPTLRLNYYPMRHAEIEIEAGANFSKERDYNTVASAFDTTKETGFIISAGYRLDF